VGLGEDGHGYVLDDLSLSGSPDTWAGQAVAAYHKYRANLVVAEANHGGDMVLTTLQTKDATVAMKKVWASQGKYARAEPVSALYEQGKMHHIGMFASLEDELVNWVPGEGLPSPNRLDALVWGLTELMLGVQMPTDLDLSKALDPRLRQPPIAQRASPTPGRWQRRSPAGQASMDRIARLWSVDRDDDDC